MYLCARSFEHRLMIFRDCLDPEEARNIGTGVARFALFVEDACVIILCRFGEGDWSAFGVPWFDELMLVRRAVPVADHEIIRLAAMLVASETLAAVRLCTFSPDFSRTLTRSRFSRLSRTWPGVEEYLRWVREKCEKKPSLAWMAEQAAVACVDSWPEGKDAAEVIGFKDEEDSW